MVQLMHKEQRRDSIMVNVLRARGHLSLNEIRADARYEKALAPLVDLDDDALRGWLMSIDGVASRVNLRNLEEFFIRKQSSESSYSRKSVVSFSSPKTPVSKRKNVSPATSPPPKRSFLPVLLGAAEFRKSKRPTAGKVTRPQPYAASRQCQPFKTDAPNMFSAMLIGDDNFLNLAVFDLKFQETRQKGRRRSGGCVSGLRIAEATHLVMGLNPGSVDHVIVNVGSVDVAEGRSLIRMITDYVELIQACQAKSIKPILTTLPPIANYLHDARKDSLLGLNHFIQFGLDNAFPVIDLYDGMLHLDGKINWNLYQPAPRFIGGSKKPFVLWNSAGRQRMYKILEHDLGFAMIHGGSHVRFNI